MLSSEQEIKTVVPQGSVLGPLLFSCYLLPLELIFKQLQIKYHFCADDTVIYFVYEETVTQVKFDQIISTLRKWFCGAKLKLNTIKTEFMKVVENFSFNADLKLHMDSKFSNHVISLGFILDDSFIFKANELGYLCLLIRATEDLLSETVDRDVLIELVRVMIISRLDYCNSLYYGLPAVLHGKLQQIINFACRLTFRLSLGKTTSRFIKQLHWLPVQKRVCSKFYFLVIG